MIKISKQNNSLIVEGIDNVFYPNNGDNSYPLNSLIVVTDNSDMATFRSVATNDVLFSGLIEDIIINGEAVTKDNIITKFDAVSNSSTGGGGGGTVDAYTKSEADAKFASKEELTNVQTVANDADTKVDALTPRVEGVETTLGNKQDTLVSGTNIKTINNQSILGEGNIEITGGDVDLTNYYTKTEADEKFATVTGFNEQAADISALQTAMDGKQATLVSGENIKTINSESILGSGDIQINGVSEEQAQEIAKIPTLETDMMGKQDTLVSGTNIKTINGNSILGEGNIEISGGAKIYNADEINSDFNVQLKNCVDHLNDGEDYSYNIPIVSNETIYDNFFNNIKYGDFVLINPKLPYSEKTRYLCEYRGTNGGFYRFVVILYKYDKLSNFTADISIRYSKSQSLITLNTNNGGPAAKITDIPNTDNFATKDELTAVETALNNKQDTLVSGTNIKTINSQSIIGSGDLTISGVSDEQAQEIAKIPTLETALNNKQDILVSGTNIKTINNQSILGEGNIEVSGVSEEQAQEIAKIPTLETELAQKANVSDVPTVQTSSAGTNKNYVYSERDGLNYKGVMSKLQVFTNNAEKVTLAYNLWGSGARYLVDLPTATTTVAGVMTAADKTKLDSIPETIPSQTEIDGIAADVSALQTAMDGKQPTLVSGTNIKTINGNSILGEGNLVIEGGGIDLSNYYNKTEVDTKLDTKQNTLVSGTNIKTVNSQSILGEGNIEVTIPDATTATSGAMSAADKTKLDSISNEWTGTQSEFDALATKEDNIIYYVTE